MKTKTSASKYKETVLFFISLIVEEELRSQKLACRQHTHMGPEWLTAGLIWGPNGLPNWGPDNLELRFHCVSTGSGFSCLRSTAACIHGLMMGHCALMTHSRYIYCLLGTFNLLKHLNGFQKYTEMWNMLLRWRDRSYVVLAFFDRDVSEILGGISRIHLAYLKLKQVRFCADVSPKTTWR